MPSTLAALPRLDQPLQRGSSWRARRVRAPRAKHRARCAAGRRPGLSHIRAGCANSAAAPKRGTEGRPHKQPRLARVTLTYRSLGPVSGMTPAGASFGARLDRRPDAGRGGRRVAVRGVATGRGRVARPAARRNELAAGAQVGQSRGRARRCVDFMLPRA